MNLSERTRREKMLFKEAADKLKERGVTLDEIANAFDPPVTTNTVNRWKMGNHILRPRDGWRAVLARLAQKRAAELVEEAGELEALVARLAD
jgi:hypothetical protein